MITMTEKGMYNVNGTMVNPMDAYELYTHIELAYNKEDLRHVLDEEYDEEVVNAVIANKELVSNILELYEKYRSSDEQWVYDMRQAMKEFRSEIEKYTKEVL